MTARTRASLASSFENGDTPSGSDFADIFDSFVTLVDTTAQATQSNISTPALTASIVSAASIYADNAYITNMTATSANADVAFFLQCQIDALDTTLCSAIAVNVQHVSASAMFITGTLNFSSTFETTSRATSGTANIVPATAHGYLVTIVNGVSVRIPYFRG